MRFHLNLDCRGPALPKIENELCAKTEQHELHNVVESLFIVDDDTNA